MAQWWQINPTSVMLGERNGFAVIVTGGWFDVYYERQHVTGSHNIAKILHFIS